jgi:hypothetical protein
LTSSYPITENALRWLESILNERFGHSWKLSKNGSILELSLAGETGKIVFDNLSKYLTETHSNQPCTLWDAEAEGWNSVLGEPLPAPGFDVLPSPLIEQKDDDYLVHYDILGLTYWMLARVEEIDRKDLDEHERFPATSSHAYKYGYLERPIVDEWMHILGQIITKKWTFLSLAKHKFETVVSCDVDHLFEYNCKAIKVLKRFAGDIVKRKSLNKALRNIFGEVCVLLGFYNFDPFYKGLKYIMDKCEENNLSALFFILIYKTHKVYDADAGVNRKGLSILKFIHKRGHKIGVHPGYDTYNNSVKLEISCGLVREKLNSIKIYPKKMASRQHFLRWKTPNTQELLDDNEISLDSTLGYADHIGFRCGTCIKYRMFNAVKQNVNKVKQLPLTVMDVTLIGENYMNLDTVKAKERITNIQDVCKRVNGSFVILWHNSFLLDKNQFEIFTKAIN